MTDPFDLVLRGDFDEAIVQLRNEDWSNGFNLGLALLAKGQTAEAYTAFNAKSDGLSDGPLVMAGVCRWCDDKPFEAVELWRAARDKQYTDPGGGVLPWALLYYAGIRLENQEFIVEASLGLESICVENPEMAWPSPIAAFLLGKFPEHEFTYPGIHTVQALQDRWMSQIRFWKGVRAMEQSRFKVATELFKDAWVKTGPGLLEAETYLARHELRVLQGSTETA